MARGSYLVLFTDTPRKYYISQRCLKVILSKANSTHTLFIMQLWSQRKSIFITYLNNAANWINPQCTQHTNISIIRLIRRVMLVQAPNQQMKPNESEKARNDLLWIGSVGPWRDIKQFSDSVHYEDVADASPEHSPFWRWAIWWVGFSRGNQIVALSRPSGHERCCHRLPLSPRWYPALREIGGIAWGKRLEK